MELQCCGSWKQSWNLGEVLDNLDWVPYVPEFQISFLDGFFPCFDVQLLECHVVPAIEQIQAILHALLEVEPLLQLFVAFLEGCFNSLHWNLHRHQATRGDSWRGQSLSLPLGFEQDKSCWLISVTTMLVQDVFCLWLHAQTFSNHFIFVLCT